MNSKRNGTEWKPANGSARELPGGPKPTHLLMYPLSMYSSFKVSHTGDFATCIQLPWPIVVCTCCLMSSVQRVFGRPGRRRVDDGRSRCGLQFTTCAGHSDASMLATLCAHAVFFSSVNHGPIVDLVLLHSSRCVVGGTFNPVLPRLEQDVVDSAGVRIGSVVGVGAGVGGGVS